MVKDILLKIKLYLLIVVSTILIFGIPVSANESRVYDYSKGLTQNEASILNALAAEISNQLNIECLVFLDYYRVGNSFGVQHAVDFYEARYSTETDGVIFYINTDTDTCHVSLHGKLNKMLNKSDKKELGALGESCSLNGGYCVVLVQVMNTTLTKLENAKKPLIDLGIDIPPTWYMLGSLILSILVTAMFLFKVYRNYKYIPETSDLEKYSSIELNLSEYNDLFLNTYTRTVSNSNKR